MDRNRTVKAIFIEEPPKILLFTLGLVCVEHENTSSRIFWLFEFEEPLGPNVKTIMEIEDPNGNKEEINIFSDAGDKALLAALTIGFLGDYEWKVTNVENNDTGEAIEYEGDIEGVVTVDSDEQDPGECEL